MNRAAYAAAIVAGYLGYHAARAIIRRIDVSSWRRAWEQVPTERRQAVRAALLSEEGITDGR
jgi:hypothetical protein